MPPQKLLRLFNPPCAPSSRLLGLDKAYLEVGHGPLCGIRPLFMGLSSLLGDPQFLLLSVHSSRLGIQL